LARYKHRAGPEIGSVPVESERILRRSSRGDV
jgi:hypothetical protein